MENPVATFIRKVIETHASGHATEHSYRPALQELFEKITELKVHNEPKRSEYGAPDFIFLKGKIVVAYAEAKDITASLVEIEKSEQMNRYYGYSNIILTNGLEFRFYRNASRYAEPIIIGKLHGGTIEDIEASFQLLGDTIKDFITESKEPIKSGSVLAKVMAGKARRIRDNVKRFFTDEHSTQNENLLSVYEVIKKLLLADLDKTKFADMYAQTLVYGLFVARYYDTSKDTFSRQEARDLVPASNPFLRHFFDHITGSSFDPRIEMIVNELCEEFTHADVQAIIHNYYKVEKDNSRDPIIHFYEDFLQEYDPIERKKMGVFYTPLPVVHFIIRSVDDILKKEFNLSQGLADSSKIEIVRDVQGKKQKIPVHRVQVLDPATGTGTFLNEAILHIKKSFEGQEGRWSQYVNTDLLPRMHGFELMMASYTIAHLKLSSTIHESGAKIENTRLGVYLTNSLEKGEDAGQTLFSTIGLGRAITEESIEANRVKNELPIMVVMGNPPYSGESSNAFYAEHDVYKVEPAGGKLKERNSKWLNDDYVKFFRFAESMIEKTGEGIVAMITAHGYIDNPTFRGMRHHLMQTFDQIYILDLHGNANKKEKTLNGGKDENVFNIKQGVAIFIGVKHRGISAKGLARIFRADCFGSRKVKFDFLDAEKPQNISWQTIVPLASKYAWVEQNEKIREEYEKGFSLNELFGLKNTGVITKRDKLCIQKTPKVAWQTVQDFIDLPESEVRHKYEIPADVRDWKFEWAKQDLLQSGPSEKNIVPISYRPFDTRFIYYTGRARGFVGWPVERIGRHYLAGENLGLLVTKALRDSDYHHIFTTRTISEVIFLSGITASNAINMPLYLYAKDGSRASNLKKEIVGEIEKIIGKTTPEDIFDYIYAVLHSPNYREKYNEFLKIDFPRVPYPKDAESFKKLVALGKELRELHLLESPKVSQFITTFSKGGSNVVDKIFPLFKDARDIRTGDESRSGIYINEEQFFGLGKTTKDELKNAYNFYIGGYQPAQKWLKDRKGRVLTNSDIEHYQKMIVALTETGRVMKEIEKIK